MSSHRAAGVNVAGYFHAELGVGEAARAMVSALEAARCPYVTLPQIAPYSRQRHPFALSGADRRWPYDVNLLCVNADMTEALARAIGARAFINRYTIGYWFWEVDPLPVTMHGAFDVVDEVWTASEYVAGILRRASGGRTPVHVVPLPLLPPPVVPRTRAQLGLPSARFVFLFVFDFLSVMARKNPVGLIEAFRQAFAPGEGPLLLIKTINGDARPDDLAQVRRAASDRSDIEVRDGYLDSSEKNALVAACDGYVSLHRAEGLGLTLAEAMLLGRPVLATGASGNRHFMTPENSWLVDARMVAVGRDASPYAADAQWAEPDLADAARQMRAMVARPREAAQRAGRGAEDLLVHHGVAAAASRVTERLDEIRRQSSFLVGKGSLSACRRMVSRLVRLR